MSLSARDKRNLLVAIVVVVAIFLLVFFLRSLQHDQSNLAQDVDVGSVLADVSVSDPESGSVVRLSSGSAQLPTEGSGGTVTLLGPYLQMGEDFFGILAFDYGGSGVFENLVMWSRNSDGMVEEKGSISLGDRVKVTGISANGGDEEYRLTVDYLDYGPGQSYADEPSVEKQVIVNVKNHTFSSSPGAQ